MNYGDFKQRLIEEMHEVDLEVLWVIPYCDRKWTGNIWLHVSGPGEEDDMDPRLPLRRVSEIAEDMICSGVPPSHTFVATIQSGMLYFDPQ
jgi:hypothetical protein